MSFYVPYKELDNVFLFYAIYKKASDDKDVVLYVYSADNVVNYNKVQFLYSILWTLGLNIRLIINIDIPHYYECVLYRGKLQGEFDVTLPELNIKEVLADMDSLIFEDIMDQLGAVLLYPDAYLLDCIDCNIHTLADINHIVSSPHNVKIMENILELFGVPGYDYSSNTKKLKQDIIQLLRAISLRPAKNISNSIAIYDYYNKLINFKKE